MPEEPTAEEPTACFRPIEPAGSPAPAPSEPFLWEFDPSLKSPEVSIEDDGARARFSQSGTAFLMSPAITRPCAVALRLAKASMMEGGSDAIGARAATSAALVGTVLDPSEFEAGVALSATGAFVVHTSAGRLKHTLDGFDAGDEVRLSIDASGTLSVAVQGVEQARYVDVPAEWSLCVSAGRAGVWEVVDELQWTADQIEALDLRRKPHALARADYAEDEAAALAATTWSSYVDQSRTSAHEARLAQMKAYNVRHSHADSEARAPSPDRQSRNSRISFDADDEVRDFIRDDNDEPPGAG